MPPKLRGTRATLLTGSLLLAISFFLPTFGGCFQISPYAYLSNPEDQPQVESTEDCTREWHSLQSLRAMLALPYLFALALAGGVVFNWRQQRTLRAWPATVVMLVAVLGMAWSAIVMWLTCDLKLWSTWTLNTEIMAVLTLVFWFCTGLLLLAARNAPDGPSALCWMALAGSLPMAAWFLFLQFVGDVTVHDNYGWYVAVAGQILLLTAGIVGLRALRRPQAQRAPPPSTA